MSIAKTLISKEIGRLKRAVSYNKKILSAKDFKGNRTGYTKFNELAEKDLKSLEADLKKL